MDQCLDQRLEQSVDERGRGLAGEDQRTEHEENQDHGHDPPGLVLLGERQQFAKEPSDI